MIQSGGTPAWLFASCVLGASLSLSACGALVDTQAHFDRAKQDMTNNDYHRAFIELKTVLWWSPHDVPALLLLSEAALQLGDPATAEEQLVAAIKQGAPLKTVAALKVRALLAEGKGQAVLDETDRAPASLDEPARLIARGAAFTLLGQPVKAEAAYRAALEADGSSAEARTRLAEVIAGEGRLGEALEELDTVQFRDPKLARAWRARAAIHGRLAQYPQMERALSKAVTYAPGQMDVPQRALLLDSLAETRLALGDLAGAQAAYGALAAIAPETPVADLVSGQLAMAHEQYDLAAEKFQSVLNTDPHLGRAHLLLAKALMEAGDPRRAESELTDMLKEVPDDPDTCKLLALVRLRTARPDAAEAALRPLEKAGSLDSEMDELLSEARMQQGDDTAAVDTLERAIAGGRGTEHLQLLLAGTYLERGAPEKAFTTLETLAADHAGDVTLLNRIAALLSSYGELERADRALTQALSIDSTDRATQLAQAELDLRRMDNTRARERLEAICRADASAMQAHLRLAQLDFQERRGDEADHILKGLVAAAAGKAGLLSAIGHLYLANGRSTEALQQFQSAAALTAGDASAWVNVAEAELALDHPEKALDAGAKALKIAPSSVPAVRVMALSELRTHQPDAALKRVQQARYLRPADAALWELEGDVRLARSEYSEAVVAFDEATQHGGSAALAMKSVDARKAAGAQDALNPLERWVLKNPGDVASQFTLAQRYEEAGRAPDARHQYEALVAKGVLSVLVFNNLACLYEKSRDSRALATAQRAYELAPALPEVEDTYGWAMVEAGQVALGRRFLELAFKATTGAGIRFHYAVALLRTGDRTGSRKILTELLKADADFPERSEAQQLFLQL
jgi:predicted Zn-dependent protease